MRALVQRVSRASVTVAGERVGEIGTGLLVLVAAGRNDTSDQAVRLAAKVARLRIFADDQGRMNRSVQDVGGAVLAVSQFTLYADVRRGNRPGFGAAAESDLGEELVARFVAELRALGLKVGEGRFGAHMQVELVNDGPVTIWIADDEGSRP
jgi:D-tyrosyl-tRNA(Tyr) deacylase